MKKIEERLTVDESVAGGSHPWCFGVVAAGDG